MVINVDIVAGGVLAVAAGLFQGVGTAFVNSWLEKRKLLELPPGHIDCFCGEWKGWVEDYWVEHGTVEGRNDTLRMSIYKEKGINMLSGSFYFEELATGKSVAGTLSNGVVQNDYATFHYRHKDESIKHYGGLILRVNGNRDSLRGSHTGYSPKTEGFVNGQVHLDKIGFKPA